MIGLCRQGFDQALMRRALRVFVVEHYVATRRITETSLFVLVIQRWITAAHRVDMAVLVKGRRGRVCTWRCRACNALIVAATSKHVCLLCWNKDGTTTGLWCLGFPARIMSKMFFTLLLCDRVAPRPTTKSKQMRWESHSCLLLFHPLLRLHKPTDTLRLIQNRFIRQEIYAHFISKPVSLLVGMMALCVKQMHM